MQHFISNHFSLPDERSSTKIVIVYMIIAYGLGVLARGILWWQASGVDAFWLEGRPLPIWSPDAGLYGYYARQILTGVDYPFSPEFIPGYFIAKLVSIFGFDLDWTLYLLPVFLAPLVAVPVVLVGHALRQTRLGFFAALISVIGVNYYTRSHAGYMDTDTLNLFLPYMAAASAMMALTRRSVAWAVGTLVWLGAFYAWYHSSIAIVAALATAMLLVTPWVLRSKKLALAAGLLLVLGAATLDPSTITQRAADYFDSNTSTILHAQGETYRFADTLETVAEAQTINPLSAHPLYIGMTPYVLAGTAGFVLLALAYPPLWIGLPLLLLGYAAAFAGMRFTMFATPAYALGFVALLTFVSNALERRESPIAENIAIVPVGLFAAILLMLLNLFRVNPSFEPYAFKADEVKALREFSHDLRQRDLIVSWWDYGWTTWYYTGKNNTLIDNGRHGVDTYLAARLLLSPDQRFIADALGYFSDRQLDCLRHGNPQVLACRAEQENIALRFETLMQPQSPVHPDRQTYLMLHRNMLLTFPVLEQFGDIDLRTGKPSRPERRFYISELKKPLSKEENTLYGDTFTFDLASGTIRGNDGSATRVKNLIRIVNGKMVGTKQYDFRSDMNLILYEKTKAIYLDDDAMNSFLVKALLLDLYDKTRFEKVAETPIMKIFRLR